MIIRSAESRDAEQIAFLLQQLGYKVTKTLVHEKLSALGSNEFDRVAVAENDRRIVGCISLHSLELFHQPGRLGRVTSLVVDRSKHCIGIGTALLEEAEKFFRETNCTKAEVNSGDHRPDAHKFYMAHGYVEDERRFLKVFC